MLDELPVEHWYYVEYVQPHYRADTSHLPPLEMPQSWLPIEEIQIVDDGAEWRVAVGSTLLDPGVAAPLSPGTIIDCPPGWPVPATRLTFTERRHRRGSALRNSRPSLGAFGISRTCRPQLS